MEWGGGRHKVSPLVRTYWYLLAAGEVRINFLQGCGPWFITLDSFWRIQIALEGLRKTQVVWVERKRVRVGEWVNIIKIHLCNSQNPKNYK